MSLLAGAAGRVLGAGEGVTKELVVFVMLVAAMVTADAMVVEELEVGEMDLAVLSEETSFA